MGQNESASRNKVTCYSGGEGAFMEWGQRVRERMLGPLLGWLRGLGMRASHVTLASLLAGVAFCPLFLAGHYASAFGMLLLHVLLDGLDGPLARFRGEASSRGSFTDTMADQVVVTVSAVTVIHAGFASVWAGGMYLFLYLVVVGFAMVRNALSAPYSWLLRPRFFVFVWFAVEVYWWPGTLDAVLWIASAVLFLKSVTGFFSIRERI